MKNIYLAFIFIVITGPGFSQSPSHGDWQTRASGNWESYTTWQIYDTDHWRDAILGDGLLGTGTPYGFSGNIWIRDGHAVTATNSILSFGSSAHLIIDDGGSLNMGDIVLSGFNPPYLAFLTINGTINTSAGINIDVMSLGSTGYLNTSFRKSNGDPGWWTGTTVPDFSSCTFDGTFEYSGINQKISPVWGYSLGNVLISGTEATFADDSTYNINGTLTVSSSTDLTLPSGTTVNGTDILIKSDASTTGSLISTGSVTLSGNVVVQRYLSGSEFHLVSSPVSGYTIDSYISDNNIDPNNANTQYAMTTYNQDSSAWDEFYSVASPPTDEMGAGLGYLAGIKNSGITSFTGGLRTSDVAVPVTNSGDALNLIGNPFTSALAVTSGATGATDYLLSSSNTDVLDSEAVAIWVYDPEGNNDKGSYVTYSQTEGDDYIPIGMGFFIKAGTNGNIELNTDMQIHNVEATFLKKSASSSKILYPLIQLHLSKDEETSSTKIYFIENQTRGLDPGWDVSVFKEEGEFQIYSNLLEGSDSKFFVQCLPYANFSSTSIPIGIDAPDGGLVSIKADIYSLPGSEAILEDKELGILTDLKVSGAEYLVELSPNTSVNDRFFLHTYEPVTSNRDLEDFQNISIFAYEKEIFVQGEISTEALLDVYDLTGRKLKSLNLQQGKLNRFPANDLRSGIYILHLNDTNGKQKVSRVFLK